MKWNDLVVGELKQHKKRSFAMAFSVIAPVAMVVALYTVGLYWEKAVERQVDSLGANLIVLPLDATVNEYYSADLQNGELPEDYVTLLATSALRGLDNVSPKLSSSIAIDGSTFVLTGILPQDEFQSKAAWQGAGIFSRPRGCGATNDVLGLSKDSNTPPSRTIKTLNEDELLIGADVSRKLGLTDNDTITILGQFFKIVAVLPATGTIDDSRMFAHLHTVQRLFHKEGVVSAIEIVGCCKEIAQGLGSKLENLLPEARIITIKHVVDAQLQTATIMRKMASFLTVLLGLVCGALIGKEMYSDVHHRKREIAVLLSLGTDSRRIVILFLTKAGLIGTIGGITGYCLGTLAAIVMGPLITGVPVLPVVRLGVYALILSVLICIAAAYFPARRASRLDPCIIFGEV